MGIFFGWFILSLIVGAVGSGRKIGFISAFFISLLLSPLVGLIFTLVSKSNEEEAYQEKVLEVQKNQEEALKRISETEKGNPVSVADELQKLKKLRDENLITEDEFRQLKSKLINS